MNQKNKKIASVGAGHVPAQDKGITLIALVVTIIVLLILAGMTINMVLGQDGIIGQAEKAKKDQTKAEEKEAIKVAQGEGKISEYSKTALSLSDLNDKLGTSIESTETWKYNNTVSRVVDGVPIPVGFGYVEGTKKDTGLIIVDGKGNEFVWIPVDDANGGTLAINYSFSPGYQRARDDSAKDGTEGRKMTASVERYGGFYVGRYETSWNGNEVESKPTQRANQVFTADTDLGADWENDTTLNLGGKGSKATWYGLKAKQAALYTAESGASVVSDMIYGCQWDAIMTWMQKDEDTARFVTNSAGMGWYSDVCGEAQPAGKDLNGGKNKVKNIYDLAGNFYEWTQEWGWTTRRVFRGGFFGNVSPVCCYFDQEANTVDDRRSSRLQLYIK